MLVKSIFFVGTGGLLILGVATINQKIKKTVLMKIILFGAFLALVSVNNFISIYYVISV